MDSNPTSYEKRDIPVKPVLIGGLLFILTIFVTLYLLYEYYVRVLDDATYDFKLSKRSTKLEQLRSSDEPRWDGPYLPKDVPLDPWGNPYVYSLNNDKINPYTLMSYGADGKEGGEDNNADIVHQ